MENIAPLAKILAEANGLDYREIVGTGPGGQITEDDVLTHLARIMSGEVEPPATPVDPEPSPAELAAAASPELLSRAGVDSDLTDLIKMQEDARAALARNAPADDFELDDEDDEGAEAPLVTGPSSQPEPLPTPEPAPQSAPGSVMGGLLSSLYQRGSQAPAPEQAPSAPAYSAPADSAPAHSAPSESSAPAFHFSGLSSTSTAAPTLQPEPEPAPLGEQSPAAFSPAPSYASDFGQGHHTAPAAPALEEPAFSAPAEQPYSAQAYAEPHAKAPHAEAEETHAQPAYAEPDTFAPPAAEPAPLAAPQAAADSAAVYLRRDVDVSAAEEARAQLSEVLGDFPLTVLLARAAQKTAGSLGLSRVALVNGSGEALSADLSSDLRATVSGLQDAASDQRQPDLLVVNAAAFDLDELHYARVSTLSLGRIQNGQAALSLSGALDPQQGARFLSDVAALLSTPVKLLV